MIQFPTAHRAAENLFVCSRSGWRVNPPALFREKLDLCNLYAAPSHLEEISPKEWCRDLEAATREQRRAFGGKLVDNSVPEGADTVNRLKNAEVNRKLA
jgi:hypothetical protein